MILSLHFIECLCPLVLLLFCYCLLFFFGQFLLFKGVGDSASLSDLMTSDFFETQ